MALSGWVPIELTNPRAGWPSTAQVRKGNPVRGGVSRNVRVNPGVVGSRPGTASALAVTAKVTGIYNWLRGIDDLVLFQEGLNFRRELLSTSAVHTMFAAPAGTRAPSFADLGPRVYMAGYSTTNTGTFQARIHDGDEVGVTPNVDVAFRPPLSTTQLTGSAIDSGPGQCTKGTHKIGFIYTNRSGYSGKPSPADSTSTLVPISVTLNAGLRTISVTITVQPLADGGPNTQLVPIMTRSDAPDDPWYFVPDGLFIPADTTIPLSTLVTRTYTISVSDEDLAASASPATDQFSLLSQAMDGTGPFNPVSVAAYGKRMCYIRDNRVYISDIDDPQAIAEDRNVVEMLNRRIILTVFPLGQGQDLYLTGDQWTGAVTDNGDFPATWPQPRMVSTTLGAATPDCVEWRTAGAYAWFATPTGAFVFDGAFPNHPATYLWTDQWKRINWNAAYAIKVRDDVKNLKCYFAVPLDSATECTHIFILDYTNGLAYDTCDISLDDYANHPTFSSIGVVKETTGLSNVWIGPSAAGIISHFVDSHDDSGSAIDSIWASGLVRDSGQIQTKLLRLAAADLWLRGNGLPTITWFNQDKTKSEVPAILLAGCELATTLVDAPGFEYQNKMDLNKVENFSFQIELAGSVDGWWSLSGFRSYVKPSLSTR